MPFFYMPRQWLLTTIATRDGKRGLSGVARLYTVSKLIYTYQIYDLLDEYVENGEEYPTFDSFLPDMILMLAEMNKSQ